MFHGNLFLLFAVIFYSVSAVIFYSVSAVFWYVTDGGLVLISHDVTQIFHPVKILLMLRHGLTCSRRDQVCCSIFVYFSSFHQH